MSNPLRNCKYCRGITLESLSNGYLHAPNRAALVRSAQKCRFCSLLFRKDRSRSDGQLFLKLEPYSDDDSQICLKLSHIEPGSQPKEQLSFFLYTSLGTVFLYDHFPEAVIGFEGRWEIKGQTIYILCQGFIDRISTSYFYPSRFPWP